MAVNRDCTEGKLPCKDRLPFTVKIIAASYKIDTYKYRRGGRMPSVFDNLRSKFDDDDDDDDNLFSSGRKWPSKMTAGIRSVSFV